MKLKRLAAAAKPFAALLGITTAAENDDERRDDPTEEEKASWAKKAESDPERKKKDDEDDGEYATRMRAMDEDEEEAAGAAAAPKETDSNEEGAARAARLDERARFAQIVTYGDKHGAVKQALTLAATTDLTAVQAIAVMAAAKRDSAAAPARPATATLSDRMAAVQVPRVGADAPTQTLDPNDPLAAAKATAAAICKAAAKARGEKTT